MNKTTCTIEDCIKDVRSKHSPYCNMHYFRIYRGGQVGTAELRKRPARSAHCEVDGCMKPDTEAGLCSMHGARKRRHGDVDRVVPLDERTYHRGDANTQWAGNDVGYGGAHIRVAAQRGPASDYACIDCGTQAGQWSYDHADPNERLAELVSANKVAYSPSPAHYDPRCVPCHKMFDLHRDDAMVTT